MAHNKVDRASDIATPGMALQAARLAPPALAGSTSAPCVALVPTPPNFVTLLPDILVVKTPFIPQEWEKNA